MLKPYYLQQGDRIRIVSPAGKVNQEKVLQGVNLLRKAGFELILGEHTFKSHFRFAGTDEQRLNDFQQAIDDPICKTIICSRGGYGAIRIADKLDFRNFRKYPKWLVGFSDITLLHTLFQQKGFCSIHGVMPSFFLNEGKPTESYTSLIQLLEGHQNSIEITATKFNKSGKASGQLIGGNLSVLYSLQGTPLDQKTDGKILFLEDLSEYLYQLDRMMNSLKLSGKLNNLNGLIVGGFTEMKDNDSPFGKCMEEIILDAVKDYNYPVCFNFPAGHIDRNLPLILGAEYSMQLDDKQAIISLK